MIRTLRRVDGSDAGPSGPYAIGVKALIRKTIHILGILGAAGVALIPSAAMPASDEVGDHVRRATVYIETSMSLSASDWADLPDAAREKMGRRPAPVASGSGFLISNDGYLITNSHVVDGFSLLLYPDGRVEQAQGATKESRPDSRDKDRPFSLRFNVGSVRAVIQSGEEGQKSFRPKIVRIDRGIDLALLKIASPERFEFLKISEGNPLSPGDPVLMAGFPGGKAPDAAPFLKHGDAERLMARHPRVSLNAGSVTAIRQYRSQRRYQLDVRANHGNSGGPITDDAGEVIGILYAGIDSLQSINYAIPVEYLGIVIPPSIASSMYLDLPDSGSGGSQSFEDFLDSGTFSVNGKKE